MSERSLIRLLGAALILSVILVATSYSVYKTRRGDWWWLWASAALTEVRQESGFAYQARTGRDDLSSHVHPSPAIVFEDGRPLGPPNAQHADIRGVGRGRFSFWHDYVYFSTSDGSDPLTNGRRYGFWYPPVGRPASRALYVTTLVVLALTFLLSLWTLRYERIRRSVVTVARGLPRAAGAYAGGAQTRASRAFGRHLSTRAALYWVVGLWIAALLLVVTSQAVFLMRTGQWTALWHEQPLDRIRPEIGFAYQGFTGREDISSHLWPSSAGMFEDGRPLGLRNAPHADIRDAGRGRYSFWYDQVYFATSDNSDPRSNGRRYTIAFSPVSRTMARALYVGSGAVVLLAVVFTLVALKLQLFGPLPAAVLMRLRSFAPSLLGAASVASLVAVGVLRATPSLAPVVTALWTAVLALNLITAWVYAVKYGRRLPSTVLAAFVIAVCISYYFLTAWAPHRSQGCHTTDPYPVWDLFCLAPDSSSYYFGYTVGSTRQPLYPWFIGALTSGTGFDPPTYIKTVAFGKIRTDPRDPLFRVVRAQILLLLAAAVVACAALMRMLNSPLPAVAFVALYDQQFFSPVELNIVLTEPLVQLFLLLLVAAFFAFVVRRHPAVLLLAATFAGLAYLGRQAAIYSALMLGVMILIALAEQARRWWKWSAAAVVIFLAFCAVPDIYALIKTGEFSRQQTHLQYQYRIAHAMQYARAEDVALMPDAESRAWLADAVVRRDAAHRRVEAKFGDDEFNRMIYYIAGNLYEVATPIAGFEGKTMTPEFYMKVATPILKHHWREYAAFSFRFWQFGVTQPGLVRLDAFDFSLWYSWAALWLLVFVLRDLKALVAATLILCHWGAVAIICLAAVPIPRMVGASEFLVVLAALILFWDAGERIADTAAWRAVASRLAPAEPLPHGAVMALQQPQPRRGHL